MYKILFTSALIICFLCINPQYLGRDFIPYSYLKTIPLSVINYPEVKVTKINAKVTAYAPHDNKSGICALNNNNPRTSLGQVPNRGIIAVDPQRIPYGSKVFIPDIGIVIAGDTGYNLRKYNGVAIDVYFNTHEDALKWGVKYLEVKVLN